MKPMRTLASLVALLIAVIPIRAGAEAAPPVPPACMPQITSLRDAVSKQLMEASEARNRHASSREVCDLYTRFAEKEEAFFQYLQKKRLVCGIQPEVIERLGAHRQQSLRLVLHMCIEGPSYWRPCPWGAGRMGTECKISS
jgi:hypothetical protein